MKQNLFCRNQLTCFIELNKYVMKKQRDKINQENSFMESSTNYENIKNMISEKLTLSNERLKSNDKFEMESSKKNSQIEKEDQTLINFKDIQIDLDKDPECLNE